MNLENQPLRQDLQSKFGLCPNFFGDPDTLDNGMGRALWTRALRSYIDAPLPSLFKERLFTYLSLFCPVEYCLLRHAGFLIGCGNVAGDSMAKPLSHAALLSLLNMPPPTKEETVADLAWLAALPGPLGSWPAPESETEEVVFRSSVAIFLQSAHADALKSILQQALGDRWPILADFLDFIAEAHESTMHRDVAVESDVLDVFAMDSRLAGWLSAFRSLRYRRHAQQSSTSEAARLKALRECMVVDSGTESLLAHLVATASQVCGTPMALITLLDDKYQWVRASVGWCGHKTSREAAFCNYTIETTAGIEVQDATTDSRFQQNPLVTGPPNIRYYAGAPLVLSTGEALGAFCVLDDQPRRLTEAQLASLRLLAKTAVSALEVHRSLLLVRADNGMMTVCAWCHAVKGAGDDAGWLDVGTFLRASYRVTHGMCYACGSNFCRSPRGGPPELAGCGSS